MSPSKTKGGEDGDAKFFLPLPVSGEGDGVWGHQISFCNEFPHTSGSLEFESTTRLLARIP